VKITALLTQYLYNTQRLDLPGIGSFILDSAPELPVAGKSHAELPIPARFEYHADLPQPKELIQFISEETGKMKALASSDLDSFIELAQQFLNIGKPFTIEGIGTLVKLKPGEYEFTPAPPVHTDRRKESSVRDGHKSLSKEEVSPRFDSMITETGKSSSWRKPLIAVVVLAGLGLAIWGGYQLSKNGEPGSNSEAGNAGTNAVDAENNIAVNDSIAATREDSIREANKPVPANYKYVLENTRQSRAVRRYNQLRTNLWDVHLETKDSVNYKLYMNLPVNYGDTSRIKDSLRIMLGRPVYIEREG
jgi:hypothetical protein